MQRLDTDQIADLMAPLSQPGPRLLRAEDVYGHIKLIESEVPLCEWASRLYPPRFIDRYIPDLSAKGKLSDAETVARVEEGKWIADCPFCPSAQVVSPVDPRFLCAGPDGCANAEVRGAFVRVTFPSTLTQSAIEVTLLERPERVNRNWLPEETVADLVEETAVMLAPPPPDDVTTTKETLV